MLEEDELPLFRAAVAAAESGSIPPIREYIEAGGDLQRQVTDDDAMAVVRTTPRGRAEPELPASGSGRRAAPVPARLPAPACAK